MTDDDDIREDALCAPPRLVEDLRAVYRPAVRVAPRVDRTVARAVWRHFAMRRSGRWAAVCAPLAAAAVVALILVTGRGSIPSGDVNGDRVVDILDAFALARRLEASQPSGARWDMNRDHAVDARDVEFIAAIAVSLR